jgi:cyclin B
MVDMYLAARLDTVNKERLQLVGAAALFVTSKFDERQPPLADDFIYVCDDAYSREELMEMEREMLKVVDFDIGMPLSYSYLRRYAKATKESMELLTLSRYILETSLLHYEFVTERESRVAAAAFALALRMSKPQLKQPQEIWTPIHEKYSDMKYAEFAPVVHSLNKMLHNQSVAPNGQQLTTILTKYSHEVFFKVATKFTLVPLSATSCS